MLRTIVLVVLTLCLAVTSVSFGASQPYLSGRVGYTVPHDYKDLEVKRFLSVAAAHGHEWNRGYGRLRLEGEVSYRQNELDRTAAGNARGHIRVAGFMINAVVAANTGPVVSPYGLIGGGGAWTLIDDAKVEGVKVANDNRFQGAYQLGAGLEFHLSPVVSLDLGYRYFSTSEDRFKNKFDGRFPYRYRTHDVGLGVLVRF